MDRTLGRFFIEECMNMNSVDEKFRSCKQIDVPDDPVIIFPPRDLCTGRNCGPDIKLVLCKNLETIFRPCMKNAFGYFEFKTCIPSAVFPDKNIVDQYVAIIVDTEGDNFED